MSGEWPAVVVAVVASGGAALVTLVFTVWEGSRSKIERAETLSERIEQLSSALASAAATITEIEGEIAKRRELVDQLEREKATAERIVSLSSDQIAAVADLLSVPVKRETAHGVWITGILTVASGGLFFAFGIAVSFLFR